MRIFSRILFVGSFFLVVFVISSGCGPPPEPVDVILISGEALERLRALGYVD
jgi:hypothetical protein